MDGEFYRIFPTIESHPLVGKTLSSLKSELPNDLYYHSSEHTIDVLHEAVLFATTDRLDLRSIELIALAAVFHDTGFIVSYSNNEEHGAKFAQEEIQGHGGYTTQEIDQVVKMILDTKVKLNGDKMQQLPTTELSKYLLDADLSNLGRNDFFVKSTLIKRELDAHGLTPSREPVINILCNKEWYTSAAKKLRSAQHQENIKAFLECLDEVNKAERA